MKDKLLNIAIAAKTIRVKRAALQKMIRVGELESYDGKLKLSDLKATFPQAENLDTSSMLEKTRFIRDNSYARRMRTAHIPDAYALYSQIKKLRLELKMEKQKSIGYLMAINELRDKLIGAEEECEGKQRAIIHKLLQSISTAIKS